MERITLKEVLELFNIPLNEEQAWALCFQCAKYIRDNWPNDRDSRPQCGVFTGIQSAILYKDGTTEGVDPLPTTGNTTTRGFGINYMICFAGNLVTVNKLAYITVITDSTVL